MIKAYWTRIVLFALVGGLIGLVASLYIPKKYEADVDIMVDQTAPMETSIAQSAQDVSTQDLIAFSRPRNISTQVEELQSLGVLTTAAQAVAQKNGLQDPTKDPNSELNPVNLQRALSIISDPTSDIIHYEVRLTNATLAQDTAQEIYNAFIEQNSANAKDLAERAIASLTSQSSTINQQLATIDQKMTDLKTKTGFADPSGQITAEISGLTTLKEARDAAAAEAAGAQKTVAVLTTELAKTPKEIDQGVTTTTNPIWEKLETDLITAQADRAALLTTYLPDNDLVKSADDRITLIRTQLAGQKHDIPAQSVKGISQSYIALESELATAKAAADAANQKVTVAQAQVDEREKYLQGLPPVEAQLAALARQQQALEKVYFSYQDSLKTLEAAKEGRMSPAEEISPATAFPDPVSPKPVVNALLGVVVGGLLALVSMGLTESKKQPLRSLAQLNSLAFAPVYRVIPELREPFRGLEKSPPECFETLLANYLRSDRRPYRVGIVGLAKDAGASTTAINLAIAGSRHAARVLLAECDAKGALARLGHKEPKNDEVIDLTPHIKAIPIPTVLDSDDHHPGIAKSVARREGDLTIIDLEPVARSAEYAFLAPYMDEVILLARAGKSRSVDFLRAQQALKDSGCPRITVVFSRSSDFSVVTDGAYTAPVAETRVPEWMMPEPTEDTVRAVQAAPREEPKTVPLAEIEPKRVPHVEPEPAPEPFPTGPEPVVAETAPASVPEATVEEPAETAPSNGTHEAEVPLRRPRTTPAVSIEDFGGIVRAKQPEPPKPEPVSKPRRGKFDTSDIDS